MPVPRSRAGVAGLQPLHLVCSAPCVKCCIIVFFISCLLNSALGGIKTPMNMDYFKCFPLGHSAEWSILGLYVGVVTGMEDALPTLFQSYLFRADLRADPPLPRAHTGLCSSSPCLQEKGNPCREWETSTHSSELE